MKSKSNEGYSTFLNKKEAILLMNGSLHKKGRYYYVVVSVKDDNGEFKTKWINTKCEKKNDAKAAQRQILSEFDNNDFSRFKNVKFVDFMEDWFENIIIKDVEKTTYSGYVGIKKKHILPYFNKLNLKLNEIKVIHLQKYFDTKFKEGLKANTLKRHRAIIKMVLNYAVRMSLLQVNPISNVIMPKVQKPKYTYYTPEELEQLLEVSKGTDIEAAVFLTIYYGLRRGEILGLRWQDISFKDKAVSINNTRTKVEVNIEKAPKTQNSITTFPLLEDVEEYLKDLRKKQMLDKQEFGDCYCDDNDYICRYSDGSPLSIPALNYKFKNLLANNNMKHIRFHDLRHSTGSYLYKKGMDLKKIQEWMRHAKLSTTIEIYVHNDKDNKKETANTMNQLFRKAK